MATKMICRLRHVRDELGMTLDDVMVHFYRAEFWVKWETLRNWDRGVSCPSEDKIERIAGILGVKPEDMKGEVEL